MLVFFLFFFFLLFFKHVFIQVLYLCEQVLFVHVFTAIPPRLSDPRKFITVLLVAWEPEQTALLF